MPRKKVVAASEPIVAVAARLGNIVRFICLAREGSQLANKQKTLSRDSHVSMYQQVADEILQRVMRGEIKAGDQLPTEPELMAQFGVSRITIRLGVDDLVERGVVMRKQGKGTFVRSSPVSHDISSIHRLIDQMHTADGNVEFEFLDACYFDANQTVREIFGIFHRKLLRVRRLIRRDGQPIGLINLYLPFEIDFSDTELFEKNWGYDLIERYGAGKVATAGLRIQVVPASAAVADSLAIAAQTPVLLLERVSRDEAGKPLECLRLFGVAGEYQLSLVLTKTEYQSAILRGVRPVSRRSTRAAKSPKSRTTPRKSAGNSQAVKTEKIQREQIAASDPASVKRIA